MANNQGPENQNPGAQQMEEGPMIDAMRGPIVEQLKILTHEFSSQGDLITSSLLMDQI